MSLAGFTHIGTYTLPPLAGVHTDFLVLLRYADLTDIVGDCAANGLDLRASTDLDVQIPIHVAKWDAVGNDILVAINVPNADDGTEIKFWSDGSSGAVAVTDPNGQYAVYSQFHFYSHDGYNNAKTGASLLLGGSPSVGNSPIGGASLSVSGGASTYQGTSTYSHLGRLTYISMLKVASLGVVQSPVTFSSATSQYTGLRVSAGGNFQVTDRSQAGGASIAESTTPVTVNQWTHVAGSIGNNPSYEGPRKIYINGTLEDTDTVNRYDNYNVANRYQLGTLRGTEPFNGEMAHVGIIRAEVTDPNWFTDVANNQNSVGAWGTMVAVGGSPVTNVDITTIIDSSATIVNQYSTDKRVQTSVLGYSQLINSLLIGKEVTAYIDSNLELDSNVSKQLLAVTSLSSLADISNAVFGNKKLDIDINGVSSIPTTSVLTNKSTNTLISSTGEVLIGSVLANKVLATVINTLGDINVVIDSTSIRNAVVTTLISGQGENDVSVLANKTLSLILSGYVQTSINPNKNTSRSASINSQVSSTISVNKFSRTSTLIDGTLLISTSAVGASGAVTSTSISAVGSLDYSRIVTDKRVNTEVTSVGEHYLLINIGKLTSTVISSYSDILTDNIKVNKIANSIVINAGGELTTLLLKDFSDTNIITVPINVTVLSNSIEATIVEDNVVNIRRVV